MRRIALNDGTWFDADQATCYEESSHFDGHNMISDATGSQWEHEEVYKTAKGTYVLHAWSQWQGTAPTFEKVSESRAYRWLVRQGYANDVPQEFLVKQEV